MPRVTGVSQSQPSSSTGEPFCSFPSGLDWRMRWSGVSVQEVRGSSPPREEQGGVGGGRLRFVLFVLEIPAASLRSQPVVPRPQPLGRSQTAAGQPGSTARQPRQAPPGPGAGWSGQEPGGPRSWPRGRSHNWRLKADLEESCRGWAGWGMGRGEWCLAGSLGGKPLDPSSIQGPQKKHRPTFKTVTIKWFRLNH